MAFMCFGKKCSFIYSIIVLALLVVVLWFVWFGTDLLLRKGEAEDSLNRLSEQLSAVAGDYGKNVKITHGFVNADIWRTDRRTVIHDVKIEVTGKNPNNMMDFSFVLGDVVITYDTHDKKMTLEISNAINVYQGGNFINSIVFSEPLFYNYAQLPPDGSQIFQHSITIPKKISLLSEMKPSGVEDMKGVSAIVAEEEKLSINFSANPTIEISATGKNEINSLNYNLSGAVVASRGDKILSFGTLKSNFNEEDGDDEGKRVGKYNFVADEVTLYKGSSSTKPYSFNVSTSLVFDNVENNADSEKTAGGESKDNAYNELSATHNREVTLNDVTMSNPDFQIRATGKFSNLIGDPLPSGEVNISIDHAQAFLNSELVAIQGKEFIQNGLAKIIGSPLGEQEQLSFTLKRQKNGVFYVGSTTFEELVTSLLSGSVMGSSSSGVGGRFPDSNSALPTPTVQDGSGSKPDGGAGVGSTDSPASIQKP